LESVCATADSKGLVDSEAVMTHTRFRDFWPESFQSPEGSPAANMLRCTEQNSEEKCRAPFVNVYGIA
jgi:hypothetical protein